MDWKSISLGVFLPFPLAFWCTCNYIAGSIAQGSLMHGAYGKLNKEAHASRKSWRAESWFGPINKDIVLKLIKCCLITSSAWSQLPTRRRGKLRTAQALPGKTHQNNPINNTARSLDELGKGPAVNGRFGIGFNKARTPASTLRVFSSPLGKWPILGRKQLTSRKRKLLHLPTAIVSLPRVHKVWGTHSWRSSQSQQWRRRALPSLAANAQGWKATEDKTHLSGGNPDRNAEMIFPPGEAAYQMLQKLVVFFQL